MRRVFFIQLLLLAVAGAGAQVLHIGIIDCYGNRTVPESAIRAKLAIREKDSIDIEKIDKQQIVQQLMRIPGVQKADINLVCCDDREMQWMLFVGISEDTSHDFIYRRPPVGKILLPKPVITAQEAFMGAAFNAIQSGHGNEDRTQGYALMSDSAARSIQLSFIKHARNYFPQLVNVLRHSGNAVHRAAAAQVIAYGSDKKKIIAELLYAIYDSDENVRNNAVRALGVMAAYVNTHSASGLAIPAAPFIKMLNSVTWTDRNKAILLLDYLSYGNKQVVLQLQQRAMPALTEMARWKNPSHAGAAYAIIGRIAHMPEQEVQDALRSDNNKAYLQKMLDVMKL